MTRLLRAARFPLFVVAGAVLAGAMMAPAQGPASKTAKEGATTKVDSSDPTRDKATFATADGVRLDGFFYKSKKGKDAPAVLLVHNFKDRSNTTEWSSLAKSLQARGFAVLAFDLRGYGGSTGLANAAKFNETAHNGQTYLKGRAKKTSLVSGEFKSAYVPYMVNDLVAARAYLDTRNDNGDCNTKALCVVGAEEGATLGMLWVASEFRRQKLKMINGLLQNSGEKGGDDIAACAWLGPVAKPHGNGDFKLQEFFKGAQEFKDRFPPTLIVFGEQDKQAKADADHFFREIKRLDVVKQSEKANAGNFVVEGVPTNLPGQKLVGGASLGVEGKVAKFFEDRVAGRAWASVGESTLGLVPVEAFGFSSK